MSVISLSQYNDVIAPTDWVIEQVPCNFNRVYYCQGGVCHYTDKNNNIQLEKGNIYILPSSTYYIMTTSPENPLDHTYFHCTNSPTITNLISVKVEEKSMLFDLLFLIKKHIETENFDTMLKLCDLVVDCCIGKGYDINTNQNIIVDAKKIIDESIESPLSLSDICNKIHLDKSYFIRSFKKMYQITPMQYILNQKFAKSLTLLREGKSITQIVEQLSFSNQANFSLSFKKKYGMSPLNYIQLIDSGYKRSTSILKDELKHK